MIYDQTLCGVDAMNNYIIVIAVFITIIGVAIISSTPESNTSLSALPNINADTHLNDMGYMQHMVMLHIEPPEKDIIVSAWASDKYPITSGRTDNNSDIVFPMISAEKYYVTVPSRNISIVLYPMGEYYILGAGV
jgi:hypothetical protein